MIWSCLELEGDNILYASVVSLISRIPNQKLHYPQSQSIEAAEAPNPTSMKHCNIIKFNSLVCVVVRYEVLLDFEFYMQWFDFKFGISVYLVIKNAK